MRERGENQFGEAHTKEWEASEMMRSPPVKAEACKNRRQEPKEQQADDNNKLESLIMAQDERWRRA